MNWLKVSRGLSWSNNWNDDFDKKVPQKRELEGFEAPDQVICRSYYFFEAPLWLAQAHPGAVAGFQLLSASPLLLNPGLTR